MRSVSLPEGPEPAVIGLDDWAWRKGYRYGTIIVDLEQGCPIDVLENRAAETVATWLQSHPDVKIVARDRAEASAAGIRQGAPDATQIADRFHLSRIWRWPYKRSSVRIIASLTSAITCRTMSPPHKMPTR